MNTHRRSGLCLLISAIAALALPLAVGAQDHGGGGGGGGGGCGDVFGDLVHILRDDTTGQPILAQRWVELPAKTPGYGWGYCPIAVYLDEAGETQEIPFLALSCDPDPGYLDLIVEVDYFGRLNGGRTKERNHRMHFDEVISNIKQAAEVSTDATGRLKMLFCDDGCSWATVDSPMESMALYIRLMKYGHIQTDPLEVDVWAHGDPSLPEQYHPALQASDYGKFDNSLRFLLPQEKTNNGCFAGDGTFTAACAEPEALTSDDLLGAAVYLAAAANKTGWITVDLVQYVNRILKITQTTAHTAATVNTLPALYRDCWTASEDPYLPTDEPTVEPAYDYEHCIVTEAHAGLTYWDEFPDIQERFVDFSAFKNYSRKEPKVTVVVEDSSIQDSWYLAKGVDLKRYVEAVNGNVPNDARDAIAGFVRASDDVVRSIEFIHNYAPPENLWCTYETEECDVL